MVRIIHGQGVEFEKGVITKRYIEGYCDSADVKPTDMVCEGSTLVETDTGDVYFYNEKSGWTKEFSFKG